MQEYERLKMAMDTDGAVWPYYVVQAYVDPECRVLLSAAIARLEDVVYAIDQGVGGLQVNGQDGVQFWCVPWARRDWHEGRIRVVGNRAAA